MSFRTTLIALALTAVCSFTANAQTDFFWSFNGLNSGVTNSDFTGTFGVGDSGTLYLFWAGGDMDTAGSLDLSLTNNSVIDFTGARTFDFAIEENGVPFNNRWLDDMGGSGFVGDAIELSADNVVGLNAFTVAGGSGILASQTGNPLLDTGYDFDADAFLFGSIDFVVTGIGSTDITTALGIIGVINDGIPLNPTFGNATIRVVPEPTSTCLIAVALLGFSATRRRQ